MNANIVLSVKGRKVFFNPHAAILKWRICFPIERIEIKNEHYITSVCYVPRIYQQAMPIEVECDKWYLPTCDRVVLPLMNNIFITNQIHDALFNDCHSVISVPSERIKQFIKDRS